MPLPTNSETAFVPGMPEDENGERGRKLPGSTEFLGAKDWAVVLPVRERNEPSSDSRLLLLLLLSSAFAAEPVLCGCGTARSELRCRAVTGRPRKASRDMAALSDLP